MPRIQAQHIDTAEPGEVFTVDGAVYIRLADADADFANKGYLVQPLTGWWGHWSCLVPWDTMVISHGKFTELEISGGSTSPN